MGNRKKWDRQLNQEYLGDLRDNQTDSIKAYDTQILYVSSGTLVLSISFIDNVIPLPTAYCVWMLFFSWIVLGFTVVLSVFSHLVSYTLHDKAIERIESGKEPVNDWIMPSMDWFMAATLTLGIMLLISFAIINVQRLQNEKTSNKAILQPILKATDTLKLIRAPKEIDSTTMK